MSPDSRFLAIGDRQKRPPIGAGSLALQLLPIARASPISVVPAADRTSALPFPLVAVKLDTPDVPTSLHTKTAARGTGGFTARL